MLTQSSKDLHGHREADILGRRRPGDGLDAPPRGGRRPDPPRRRALPGSSRRGRRAQREPAVRPPADRRDRGEPRAPRPHRPASPPGSPRLPRRHLRDARPHIQESDAPSLAKGGKKGPESEPLYNLADALAVQELIVGLPYRRIHYLRKNLAFEYTDAGHILGSASVDLRLTEGAPQRIVFSGDIGRVGLPIIRDPEPPSGPIDTLRRSLG